MTELSWEKDWRAYRILNKRLNNVANDGHRFYRHDTEIDAANSRIAKEYRIAIHDLQIRWPKLFTDHGTDQLLVRNWLKGVYASDTFLKEIYRGHKPAKYSQDRMELRRRR